MDKNKKLFPQRLWDLIHDEKYNFCLRWSLDGQRVYLNRNDFETHYLRTSNNQFHTQKAISFVRQMNMYGFRKVDDCYYENDNFKRNCPYLLKNMERRHSNKGFFLVNNLVDRGDQSHNQYRQQQQQVMNNIRQQQQHRFVLRKYNRNFLDYQAIYEQNRSSAMRNSMNADIGRQTAQYNVSGPGSVGNIGAAIAAINSSASAQLPLSSTLYRRLTALNFSNSDQNEPVLQQHRLRQQRPLDGQLSLLAPAPAGDGNLYQLPRPDLPTQQLDNVNLPITQLGTQQSITVRQAIQETLFRSMLQLKQATQSDRITSHNLLSNIQQQNPNHLLESVSNWSTVPQNSPLVQPMVPPIDIVANPASSLTCALQLDNQRQQLKFDNNSLLNLLTEQANMTNPKTSPALDRSSGGNKDFMMDFDEDSLNRNWSLMVNSSSSSSTHEVSPMRQDFDNDDNLVLNLAKPSKTGPRDV